MRSVWLMGTTLQLSGQRRRELGKCRSRLPTVATSHQRAPKVPTIPWNKPQVCDRRLITPFSDCPGKNSSRASTDRKDFVEAPLARSIIHSLLGTL